MDSHLSSTRIRASLWRILTAMAIGMLGTSDAFGKDTVNPADGTRTPPSVIRTVNIDYPQAYLANNVTHTVVAEVSLDAHGVVRDVTIHDSPYPAMAQAVKEALFRFQFSPALENGQPIACTVKFQHTFVPPTSPDAQPPISEAATTAVQRDANSEHAASTQPPPEWEDNTEFETIVTAPPPEVEVVKYGVSQLAFTRMPGASEDPIKTALALPGVGQSFDGDGAVIVRGSQPADTGFYMDGLSIPVMFHMDMSGTSVLRADLLKDMTFYPGNFSVRYGDAMGGIIHIAPKTLDATSHQTTLASNLKYSGFTVEGPLNKDWQWAAAARHSYPFFDTRFREQFHPDYPVKESVRFYDYQGILQKQRGAKRSFRLFLFGSDDDATTTVALPELEFEDRTRKKVGFHKIQLKWQRRLRHNATNQLHIALGYQRTEPELYSYKRFVLKAIPVSIREELTVQPADAMNLRLGLDTWMGYARWEVTNFSGRKYNDETPFVFPGVYGEFEWFPMDRLTTVTGLRISLAPRIMRVGVDPRFSMRYRFSDHTTFKSGFGFFHQPPSHEAQDEDYGNDNLKLQRAVHYNVGVTQQFNKNIYLDLEGFYRNLSDLVVRKEEVTDYGYAMVFSNEGRGQVVGLEAMLKHSPTDRFMGWISYTLLKATTQSINERKYPSPHDQRHVLTIWGNVNLGHGWNVGTKFQLASGIPYTPVIGHNTINAPNGTESTWYTPIWGTSYSARMPLFHQLDFRIEKRFKIKQLAFSSYLEILNVYNQRTPKQYFYLPNSTKRYAHAPNHFYPNLGVTASF